MKRDLRVIVLAMIILLHCGPAARAQSTTLDHPLQRLHATLASIPYLNESDLLTDDIGSQYQAAESFVRKQQCSARMASPLLAIALPPSVSLQGNLDPSGSSQVPDRFELRLRIVPLHRVPEEHLKETTALAQNKSMPAEAAARLQRQALENYDKLINRVSQLINTFDIRSCPSGIRRQALLDQELPFIFISPTY